MSGPFVHLGVLYTDPEELAAAVVPRIHAALDAGDTVITVLDRRTTAVLREGLGERGPRVAFRAPSDLLRPGPERFVDELRSLAGRGPRPFVVGQYQAFTTAEDAAFWETAATLVLDDQRLTLVCACARGAGRGLVDLARASHPTLLTGSGLTPNPGARAPDDRSPTPSSMWGGRALRMTFRGPADLGRVRERVARVTDAAGFGADRSAAALLAVHEAALLVCGSREGRGECTLEVRRSEGAVLTEVVGPGPAEGHLDRAPLRYVELFSDGTTLAHLGGSLVVRVLSTTGPPPP